MRTTVVCLFLILTGQGVATHAASPSAASADGAATRPGGPSARLDANSATNAIAKTPQLTPSRGSAYSDLKLERLVRRILQDDPVTRPFAPKTTVQNGIATLSGETFHPEAKREAERALQGLPGLRSIRDLIKLDPNADLQIAQRLHEALARDSAIHEAGIAVAVIDGKVFLSGTAESTNEVARITEVVWTVPGVRTISNGLEVSATAARGLPGRVTLPAYQQPYSRIRTPSYR